MNRQQVKHPSATRVTAVAEIEQQPAATAAARVSRAGLLLGTLGLASALFVIARLLESWHVGPKAASHHISIFGRTLAYPTANFDAVVILALAILGLVVTAIAVLGAVRELTVDRRFRVRLATRGLRRLRGAWLIDDEHPRAFCAGLLRPRVYISTGAVALLDESALDAVLAHERHHAHRHDPLRLAAGRVLARALFFVPGLADLVRRQQALAELSADESAINAAPGNRSALARAMLSLSDASAPGDSVGIDPARVDYLLGEPPAWRFPALLCAAAVAVIALEFAVAVLAGQVAGGSATLAPPFLSRQPCIVVLAAIPAALGFRVASYGRRLRTRSVPSASLPPRARD